MFPSITFCFLTKQKFRSYNLWTITLLLLLWLAAQSNGAFLIEPVKFCTRLNIHSSFQPACANFQIQSPNSHIYSLNISRIKVYVICPVVSIAASQAVDPGSIPSQCICDTMRDDWVRSISQFLIYIYISIVQSLSKSFPEVTNSKAWSNSQQYSARKKS